MISYRLVLPVWKKKRDDNKENMTQRNEYHQEYPH